VGGFEFTVPQLFWAAVAGEPLKAVLPGRCAVCGGPLVGAGVAGAGFRPSGSEVPADLGVVVPFSAFGSDNWTDMGLVADRSSGWVCGGCFYATRESVCRSWGGVDVAGPGEEKGAWASALLVAAGPRKRGYSRGCRRQALEEALALDVPFALLVRYPPSSQPRHVLPYVPLSSPGGVVWVAFNSAGIYPADLRRVLALADGAEVPAPRWERDLARWVAAGNSERRSGR
jgi:hypothetical protein